MSDQSLDESFPDRILNVAFEAIWPQWTLSHVLRLGGSFQVMCTFETTHWAADMQVNTGHAFACYFHDTSVGPKHLLREWFL